MVQEHSTREKGADGTGTVSWEGLEAILLVGRHGTVRAAAKRLGVAHTTLAHRVAAAERALGTAAFVKSVKGYVPTEDGRRIIAHAERMAFEARAIRAQVGAPAEGEELTGTVRIAMISPILTAVLAQHLEAFAIRYPGLTLDLVLDDRLTDLDRQSADVAVRLQGEPAPGLVGRRLCGVSAALYGSRATVERLETGSKERAASSGVNRVTPVVAWGRSERALEAFRELGVAQPRAQVTARPIDAQVAVATRTSLIADLPCFVGDTTTELVRVDPRRTRPLNELWVLTHDSLRQVPRVRAIVDFLVRTLRDRRSLFEGHDA